MKPSSHTSQNATNASLRRVPFVTPTLSRAKGKNFRTTRQSLKRIHSVRNDLHGVTLIEMLVALVITAIIVSSVYVAFNAGTKSWQVGDTMMQKYQNARGALDFMTREMSAMYMTISNIYETGLFYSTDSLDGSDGEFRFVAAIPADEHTGKWDLCKIGYRLDSTDKEIERAFKVDPDLTNFAPETYQPLASNVTSLGFKCRYWNGSSWAEKEEWDSREGKTNEWDLPEAVEISITVQDDKQIADPRTFTTIVRIQGSGQ